MLNVLLAVDGSDASNRGVKKLVETAAWYREKPTVHLLTVHLPVPRVGGMSRVIGKNTLDKYYREESRQMIKGAEKLLDKAGIPYQEHVQVGQVAECIVKMASELGCDFIYMGTRGLGAVSNLVLGSTATKVLHMTKVPVVMIR